MLMESSAYLIAPAGLHTCHSCQPEKTLHFTSLNLFLFKISFLVNNTSLSLSSTVLNPLVPVINCIFPELSLLSPPAPHLSHCVLMGGPQVHLIRVYIFGENYQPLFKMRLL